MTKKEYAEWQRKWQSTYAQGVFRETGKWSLHGKDYHAFDARFMTHLLRGAAAEAEYESVPADSLIVLFQNKTGEAGERWDLDPGRRPSVAELKTLADTADFLIFPPDLSWTAFFHHEDQIPTLFSRREWASTSEE